MPAVPFNVTLGASATADVDLAPFDRLGGGGGRVAVRAFCDGATGDAVLTLMIGSEVIQSEGPLFVGTVIDRNTPVISGLGAAADTITIRLRDASAAGSVIIGIADIENA